MRSNILVQDWAKDWMKIATAGKGQSHIDSIRNAVNNHILPCIGSIPLCEVNYADVSLVLAAASAYSYSLRSKILVNMKGMFEVARRSHLIAENPCEGLKAGPRRYKEKSALSKAQQEMLEAAVRGTRAETFVLLGLYTGMRREEILGLMWDCVDLRADVPFLSVRRALRWEHSRPCVSEVLKSSAARRIIPIPERLLVHLESLHRSGNYVIGGDAPLTQTQFKNLWSFIERRTVSDPSELGTCLKHSTVERCLDFRVTPHQLRHTYITRLVASGANIKHVQYLAGHSDLKMTLQVYTHIMNENPAAFCGDVYAAFDSAKAAF